jgi:hypothetical protein
VNIPDTIISLIDIKPATQVSRVFGISESQNFYTSTSLASTNDDQKHDDY